MPKFRKIPHPLAPFPRPGEGETAANTSPHPLAAATKPGEEEKAAQPHAPQPIAGAYPRYPAYKDAGVEWLGEVPEHWGVSPLFAMMNEREEKNTGNLEQNVLSLSYGRIIRRDIESNFGLLPESFETYQILYPGDIVLRLTDLQNDHRSLRVGAVQERGIITSAYVGLKPSSTIDSRFVFYLLNGYDLLKVFYGFGGGVRQSMNFKDLRRLPLLMPSLPEQRAIADFLDGETARIDALVAKQEALIALLQEKRKAVISHAVTKGLNADAPMKDSGVAWLGEVPSHWEVKRLKYVLIHIEQGWSPDSEDRLTVESEWGVLKTGCVNRGVFRETEHKTLPNTLQPRPEYEIRPGDVLMSRANGSIDLLGSVALVNECRPRLMLSDKIYRLNLRPELIDKHFLTFVMNSQSIRHQIEQAASGAEGLANNIAKGSVREFWLVVPTLDEQHQIVEFIETETARINALIAKAEQFIERLREHRTALIAAAVTGKIDVRAVGEGVKGRGDKMTR